MSDKKPSADTVERARIVKYLRGMARKYGIGDMADSDECISETYMIAADAIEQGKHRVGKPTEESPAWIDSHGNPVVVHGDHK